MERRTIEGANRKILERGTHQNLFPKPKNDRGIPCEQTGAFQGQNQEGRKKKCAPVGKKTREKSQYGFASPSANIIPLLPSGGRASGHQTKLTHLPWVTSLIERRRRSEWGEIFSLPMPNCWATLFKDEVPDWG